MKYLSLLVILLLASCTSTQLNDQLVIDDMEFKKIDAGSFEMGTDGGGADQQPARQITLSKDYYLASHEFTQGLWLNYKNETIRDLRDKANREWSLRGMGENHPVYYVSWDEVQSLISQLNKKYKSQLPAGYIFALPTEAQWEYACRSKDGMSPKGDLANHAWFDGNSDEQCHAVGKKQANAWGLYDMYGNVWEWCADNYDHYDENDLIDPRGLQKPSVKVSRGASWHEGAGDCYAAKRDWYSADGRLYNLGFRLAIVKQK